MPAIQILILVLVGGGLTLFAVSNLSPVLPLVFLGMQTVALPIAAWVGIAIAAGALTSFFLQFLGYLQGGSSSRRLQEPDEVRSQSRSFRRETPENPEPEPQTYYTPPPPSSDPPSSSTRSDWEESGNQDWDFEDEPAAQPSTRQDFGREFSEPTPPQERTSYEVPQEPKTRSQTGSVYSYSYREPKDPGVGKTDEVYDANYRIITPPYQPAPKPEEDEEDWGFEDDEDFDFDDGPGSDRRQR